MKSKEAKAWEAKAQSMIDQIMVHLDQAKESHREGQHDQEQRHRDQVRSFMDRYNAHIRAAPRGARAPKLPRVT